MGKSKKRFVTSYETEGGLFDMQQFRIIVDTETGVNYLCTVDGGTGGNSGITPLLNSDGCVVVTIPERDPFE